jgi:metal transporter CNNM
MTSISDIVMLSIESRLDYETLKQISLTGHSRVPVYEEVDIPVQIPSAPGPDDNSQMTRARSSNKPQPQQRLTKVKKIIGILLVKQCVLLDPKGAYICFKFAVHD